MSRISLAIAVVVSLFALDRTACAQGWSPGTLFGGGTSPSAELPGEGDPFLAAHSTAGPIGRSPQERDDLTWVTLDRSEMDLVDHSETYGASSDVGRATFNTMDEHALQDVGYSTLDLLPQEFPPKPPALPNPKPEPSVLDLIMKPAVDFRWEPKKNGFGVLEFWGGFQVPLVPAMKAFGPPPPMISFNFGYNDLQGVDEFYSFSIGLNWYRPVNKTWAWYFSLQPMVTTDLENTSGDMWRVKANAFAFYTVNPELTWSFGVLVTGRSDIPILPLIGVVWYADETTKFDLTFPRPRIYKMLSGDGEREQWFYVGGELGGGTWAWELPGGFEDELTYRAYRFACGVEFVPAGAKLPGGSSVPGEAAYIEAGLSFGRNLSLDRLDVDADQDSVFYLGGGLRF
jgi:hypothetical protein